jgi:hypothetical protein
LGRQARNRQRAAGELLGLSSSASKDTTIQIHQARSNNAAPIGSKHRHTEYHRQGETPCKDHKPDDPNHIAQRAWSLT